METIHRKTSRKTKVPMGRRCQGRPEEDETHKMDRTSPRSPQTERNYWEGQNSNRVVARSKKKKKKMKKYFLSFFWFLLSSFLFPFNISFYVCFLVQFFSSVFLHVYLSPYFTFSFIISWLNFFLSLSYFHSSWFVVSPSHFWVQLQFILMLMLIYLLTAVGLSPGGSSTVHIYTQKIHRTTQWNTILRTEHT